MFFRPFFMFLLTSSTLLIGLAQAKTKEERQPIGERSVLTQLQPQDATDVRQPVGTREVTSKDKENKDRQPIGNREIPSASNKFPQPMERPVPQSAKRQPIGGRASPAQKQQQIVTDIRQPIGARETHPNRTPQRIERPTQFPSANVQVIQRPEIRSRALPKAISIDRRSASYGSATFNPHLISRKGDFIQLDDGSQWKVRHKDQKRVRGWNPEDLIVIETGQHFTWSIYKLVNYSSGESCDVELIQPARNGLLSHWITEIHPYDGYLRLQDGSVWRMDTSELLNWNVNDDVIIGLSKNLFSGHYSYFLINPRAKTRLQATFSLSF